MPRLTESEYAALMRKRDEKKRGPVDFLQAEADRLKRQNASVDLQLSESKIQCEGVALARDWLRDQGLPQTLLFAIPNGADVSDLHRIRLVQEGLTAGVADLLFVWYPGLFIEVKRPGQKLRTNQAAFRDVVLGKGYHHCVAYSPDEILQAVKQHVLTVA